MVKDKSDVKALYISSSSSIIIIIKRLYTFYKKTKLITFTK